MGLLDSMKSMVGGGAADSGAHASVASAFFDAVGQHPGGMSGVLDHFRQNGMGQHVDSWQQSGTPNQPISPQQAQQGLGSGLVDQIAQRSGLSPTVVTGAMAVLMPMVVSHFAASGGAQGGGLAGMAQGFLSKL